MKRFKIVYEDKNLIVIDKEAKLLTINTDNKFSANLYSVVREYEKKKNPKNKIFIVHRLDKETSGLIIFAKNEKTKRFLQDNWSTFTKKYYALVEGKVNNGGVIEQYLKESKTLQVYVTKNKKDGKYAKTSYEVIKSNSKYSLLQIEIFTGRKNQIRVALASINHPIVGDKKYYSKKNPIKRLGLHAYYLKIIDHDTHQYLEFISDIPDSFNIL